MSHSATSPTRKYPRRGILLGNHNETLIAARPTRLVGWNHNETLIAARPTRSITTNHNETLIAARPAGSGLNHNETLIAARATRSITSNHNETLIAAREPAGAACLRTTTRPCSRTAGRGVVRNTASR